MVIGLGLGALGAQAETLDVYWIGPTGMGGDGNWSTAADWSGGVVPNNGDGNTYNVTLPTYPAGPYWVDLDMSPAVDSLTLEPGTFLYTQSAPTLTTASLTNAGTLDLGLRGNGNLYVNGALTNSGSLYAGQAVTVTGDIINSGYFLASNSDVTAAHFVQPLRTGVTDIDSSTMNVTDAIVSGENFGINYGSTLNGNLTVNGGGSFTAAGEGVLNGNFSFTTAPGSAYEQEMFFRGLLKVSGDASLDGRLLVNFVHPIEPGAYEMMTYRAKTGQFDGVGWSGLGPNQTVTLDYGPTALDVVVHGSPVPEPASLLLMGTGLLALAYCFRRKLARSERFR